MKKLISVLALTCWVTTATWAAPQEHAPNPEAKAAFEKARSMGIADWKAAAAAYRKAVDLDPDFYDAHHYYILFSQNAAGTSDTAEANAARKKVLQQLDELYQGWARKSPNKAVYPWALGILWDYEDPDKAVRYYQQALKVDPQDGPAYDMLAISAEEHGDLELSREYGRKAHESWPNDVAIWRHYMGFWVDADHGKAEQIGLEMAEKFPTDGTSMLGYLAGRATDEKRAREMYELLREKFPKAATGYALMPLFNIYLKTDRPKALGLAEEMVKNDPASKEWPLLREYATAVVDAEALIAQEKGTDALAALDKVKPPRNADSRVLDLTRAKALDLSGQTEKAYSGLAKVFADTPSDEVHAALFEYGEKLGKDWNHVEADIGAQRSASAKPGIPFSLLSYVSGKPVATSQYRGKVFLVNFFYPKCGPCRGEFPYLQAALQKYKEQGFEILAINGHPPEDDWVMPLIKGWKLGFVPLKGTEEVVKAYKVRGYPANFLYGPDGRIYPMPHQVRPATVREFELQVEALLEHAHSIEQTE